ncbi:hypothetical protein NLX86_31860 [Streptomyces sp. A3M-1-3]|uniref:hypothetical protein n=1 Tax=Streptomyces sp. A3M-1-3 TaxID=2962044 RepID=UPI0020B8E3A9|nr:hypothetical protein [Streptomyces sp. A3M-1-3]MCP3822518.1 hypothetical protein [Streptomyces sp. A3M-1-3]
MLQRRAEQHRPENQKAQRPQQPAHVLGQVGSPLAGRLPARRLALAQGDAERQPPIQVAMNPLPSTAVARLYAQKATARTNTCRH